MAEAWSRTKWEKAFTMAKNMNVIEMSTYYDIPLHCPFCGAAATKIEDDELVVVGCKHLQLLTAVEFTVYMSERFEALVKGAGYEVTRDDCEVSASNPDDDDDWPDLIGLASQLPDVIVFEQVVGPPSLEVSYTIFAYNDADYEKFSEAL